MFEPTRGAARELVDKAELQRLQSTGTVIADERRRRSKYFDGRFLVARDLTRDQNYFLTRQADLGRAGGAGVVFGLMVRPVDGRATSIQIEEGHGVTPSGESVVLPCPLTFDLSDLPAIERLDATFGLSSIPRDPARNPSGLFVIALRPVEFTANPIASYPTSLAGSRTVQDGDIIEGVAVSLIPYPDEGTPNEMEIRRARAAREIFVSLGARGIPARVLPLAMVGLDRGVVRWVDPFLVRREVWPAQEDLLGLGVAPRTLRQAHFLQYEAHLSALIEQRRSQGLRFAASEHFLALPPAGRFPAAAIDPREFTQIYFPPEADVVLSILPEDEIPALVEESLRLPPIDLTLSSVEQDSTALLVLIPLPRQRFREFQSRLPSLERPFKSAAPGMVARRSPLETMRGMLLPRLISPEGSARETADADWQRALQAAADPATGLLWYVRRRNLPTKSEAATVRVGGIAPTPGPVTPPPLPGIERPAPPPRSSARKTPEAPADLPEKSEKIVPEEKTRTDLPEKNPSEREGAPPTGKKPVRSAESLRPNQSAKRPRKGTKK